MEDACHTAHNPEVAGSNPAPATNGRRFRRLMHTHKPLTSSFRSAACRLWGLFVGTRARAGQHAASSHIEARRRGAAWGTPRAALCRCPTQRSSGINGPRELRFVAAGDHSVVRFRSLGVRAQLGGLGVALYEHPPIDKGPGHGHSRRRSDWSGVGKRRPLLRRRGSLKYSTSSVPLA
jgi:hypothetical protein